LHDALFGGYSPIRWKGQSVRPDGIMVK